MVTEVRDYGQAIRTVGRHLWGLHACENDRGVPGGGIIPWESIFAALDEMNFDGYMIMEAYNSSIPGFAWQRGMFHNVCPDAQAYIRQGLRFLNAVDKRNGVFFTSQTYISRRNGDIPAGVFHAGIGGTVQPRHCSIPLRCWLLSHCRRRNPGSLTQKLASPLGWMSISFSTFVQCVGATGVSASANQVRY